MSVKHISLFDYQKTEHRYEIKQDDDDVVLTCNGKPLFCVDADGLYQIWVDNLGDTGIIKNE